jgi:predicted peptidase
MSRRDLVTVVVLAWACWPLAGTVRGATKPKPSPPPSGRFVLDSVRVGEDERFFSVWLPPAYESAGAWPAILFLHGSGESGADGIKPTTIGMGPALRAHPNQWPFVVVFPQKPREDHEWEEHEDLVFAVFDRAATQFRVDTARVALCGVSQGGHGAWMLGARYPERWTCLVPICGYGRARTVSPRVARLPVWAFHGLMDDLVDPADTRNIVEGIRLERRRLDLPPDSVRMTLYPEANHNSWDSAFAERDLPAWVLRQSQPR